MQLKPKVLFLDVDGVLNTSRSRSIFALSRPLVRRVERIVNETDCDIVVSSTWRLLDEGWYRLKRKLEYRGIRLAGATPDLRFGKNGIWRGHEIAAFLQLHDSIERYAIVDDDSDMLDFQLRHFFQTDPDYGLTDTIAYRIIQHLNGKAEWEI